eukprot:scaffold4611_cov45-Cyclotella_meneghiniana.AAC.1
MGGGPVQSATFRMKGARVFQARFSLGAYDRFPQQVKVESVGAEEGAMAMGSSDFYLALINPVVA